MSGQEESVDSRTSMVGRKRARDDSVESGEVSGASADESYNGARKRVRQDDETDLGAPSPEGGVTLVAAVGIQTEAPAIVSEARALGWNKGVQSSGMRTSFGAKKQSKYTIQPSPEEDEISLVDEPVVALSHRLDEQVTQPEPHTEEELSKHAEEAVLDPFRSDGNTPAAGQPGSFFLDIGLNEARDESSNAEALSKPYDSSLPLKPTFNTQANTVHQETVSIPRPEPPTLQSASNIYYVDVNKTKELVSTSAPPASEFRGVESQLQQIPVHMGSKQTQAIPTKKERKAAAAEPQMITRTEIQAAIRAVCAARNLGANKTGKLVAGHVTGTFTKKQVNAYNGMDKKMLKALPEAHKQVFRVGIAEYNRRKAIKKNSGQNLEIERASHTSGPITIDDDEDDEEGAEDSDSYDPETALILTASASVSGSQWAPVNTPVPPTTDEILESLNEAELLLQLKYFPTDDGRLYIPRCLFCTETSHATYDCPATFCTSCGENSEHSTMSCPKTQRCGKCREQGHPTSNCPSKLIRSRSEAIPCDLCGSSAHIERSCHMIWRSFCPKPAEIKTVRTFPIDCYTCGQENHLGPECGLYQGPGNLTWSRSNFSKYVDNASTRQVVSAGVDYTIKSKAKKAFTIKGKANDPINLDDSDDDQGFIHTKIRTSTGQKGHIQFGNMQPPSGPRGNPSRSSFAGDSYAPVQPRVQGGRYERERTFSPPRFDRYPPPQQYQQSGGDYSGGSSYQDRSRPPPQQKVAAAKRPKKPKNNNKKAKARNAQQGGH